MYVRLGFAVAINVDPDILLVDEVLAVGDANFQDRCMQKFADFRRLGRTVMLASHALGSVQTMCDEVGELDEGRLVEIGAPGYVVGHYLGDAPRQIGIPEGEPRSEPKPAPESHPEPPAEPEPAAARITKVEVFDAAGFEVAYLQTGDQITFRLHYLAIETVDKPVFALALDTQAGVRAWAQHSRDAPFIPDRIEGPGSVDLQVPRLALQNGSYSLHASILDDSMGDPYDARPECCRLEVFNDFLNECDGIAVFGGQWSNSVDHQQPGAFGKEERENAGKV